MSNMPNRTKDELCAPDAHLGHSNATRGIPQVTVEDLFVAGVHFGHDVKSLHPTMSHYVHGVTAGGTCFIDLRFSLPMLQAALSKIYETTKSNGEILFVGSKSQAKELITECAQRCAQFHATQWSGGTLTNWSTISKSLKKLGMIEKELENPDKYYNKKETLMLERVRARLKRSLGGMVGMKGEPDLLVVIDINKEAVAVKEAFDLGIPVIAVVDTNTNPGRIEYPIPGNDDATRAISLYCRLFADAALAGIEHALAASGVDVGASAVIAGTSSGMQEQRNVKKLANKSRAFNVSAGGAERRESEAPQVSTKKRVSTE